jgi:hypothetical protein
MVVSLLGTNASDALGNKSSFFAPTPSLHFNYPTQYAIT